MGGFRLADILFIFFICLVIYGILSRVHRGKKNSAPSPTTDEKEKRHEPPK